MGIVFCRKRLNLNKSMGDLVGPFSFALLMGLGRLFMDFLDIKFISREYCRLQAPGVCSAI